MPDDPLAPIENALERARDLPEADARELLASASSELESIDTAAVDDDRRRSLQTRLSQRRREISERDAYDSGLGAAMGPDEEDAP